MLFAHFLVTLAEFDGCEHPAALQAATRYSNTYGGTGGPRVFQLAAKVYF